MPRQISRLIIVSKDEPRDGAAKISLVWKKISIQSRKLRRALPGEEAEILTKPTCMAIPTARLSDPPMLLPFHATPWGTLGYIPHVTRKQAKYLTLLFWTTARSKNPNILKPSQLVLQGAAVVSCETNPSRLNPIMYMPRFP